MKRTLLAISILVLASVSCYGTIAEEKAAATQQAAVQTALTATAQMATYSTATASANDAAIQDGGKTTSCKDAAILPNTVGSDNLIQVHVKGVPVQQIEFMPQHTLPFETYAYVVKNPDGSYTGQTGYLDYAPGVHSVTVEVTDPPAKIITLFALCEGKIHFSVGGYTHP